MLAQSIIWTLFVTIQSRAEIPTKQMRECGVAYQAARAANDLKGASWEDYLSQCVKLGHPPALSPSEPFPKAVAPSPEHILFRKCGESYEVARAANELYGRSSTAYLALCTKLGHPPSPNKDVQSEESVQRIPEDGQCVSELKKTEVLQELGSQHTVAVVCGLGKGKVTNLVFEPGNGEPNEGFCSLKARESLKAAISLGVFPLRCKLFEDERVNSQGRTEFRLKIDDVDAAPIQKSDTPGRAGR